MTCMFSPKSKQFVMLLNAEKYIPNASPKVVGVFLLSQLANTSSFALMKHLAHLF